MALLTILVSLFLLSISVGFISPKENFSLAGLGFNASKVAILWGGGMALIAFALSTWMLDERVNAYRRELHRLYQTIDFDLDLEGADVRPFEIPDTLETLIRNVQTREEQFSAKRAFQRLLSVAVAVAGFVALPLLAEIAVVVKLYFLAEGGPFWVWGPSILLVAVLAGIYYVMLRE